MTNSAKNRRKMRIINLNCQIKKLIPFAGSCLKLAFKITLTKPDILWNVNVQNATVWIGYVSRNVTSGATGTTVVAPKCSDTLNLFIPGWGREDSAHHCTKKWNRQKETDTDRKQSITYFLFMRFCDYRNKLVCL